MEEIRKIFDDGGVLAFLLAGMLLISLWIFLERFFYYHRLQVDVADFLHGLFNIVRNRKVVEAVAICDSQPTPVSAVVRAVITHYEYGALAVRQATDEVAMTELPKLERGVKLMAGLGNIAPILGLLGTLISMMKIFESISTDGNFTPMQQLIGPIRSALWTTVLGLAVALLVHVFYFILTERLNSIVGDMEKASAEMSHFMLTKDWAESGNRSGDNTSRKNEENTNGEVEN